MRSTKINIYSCLHYLSIILLIIASICFYNLETMSTYLTMCMGSMLLSIGATGFERGFRIMQEKGIKYILLLYSIYTFYGLLFLRAGDYNWDFQIFSCVQSICFYFSCRHFFSFHDWYKKLAMPFMIGGLFVVFYIFTLQQEIIMMAQVEERVGEGLSGNVNTVGYSLGIVSFAITYYYCVTKKKWIFLALIPVLFMMLLTGSKKTVIIIVIDIMTLYVYGKAKVSSFLKLAILFSVLVWVVLEVPYFYEVIGKRIEDMYTTLTGSGSGDYSHSTDDRNGMISDAFRLGMNYPIFGGGMNYFAAASKMFGYYGYSHCNYTELFCNFGIVGVLIYYVPYFKNIRFFWRLRKQEWERSIFVILWLVMSLILGWAMVAFSGLSNSYMPIMASFAMMESVKLKYKYVKNTNIAQAVA